MRCAASALCALRVFVRRGACLACCGSSLFVFCRSKDAAFLRFFFKRLQRNDTAEFGELFPFVAHCGKETNYVACEDRPVVFQVRRRLSLAARARSAQLTQWRLQDVIEGDDGAPLLTWGSARLNVNDGLTVPFDPSRLLAGRDNGRLYYLPPDDHALPCGGVGLVRSQLCVELGEEVEYDADGSVHLVVNGKKISVPFVDKAIHF